jgi:hypothetical protein
MNMFINTSTRMRALRTALDAMDTNSSVFRMFLCSTCFWVMIRFQLGFGIIRCSKIGS